MAKLLVLYKTPQDTAAFDKHYAEVHIPLVHKIPNLKKFEVSQSPIMTPMGPSSYYFIAELHFADLETLQTSFAGPEGRAAGEDAMTNLGQMDMLIYQGREA